MRNFLLFTLFLLSMTKLNATLATDSVLISRDSIVLYAKNYIGLPYRYASRSPTRGGFDCSGFTMFVLKKFGIQLSPSSSAQSLQGDKILLKNAIPGDLVFFRRSKRGRVFHVALVSKVVKDSIFIIHSTTHGGLRIDNLATSNYWKSKYKSVRNVLPGARNYTVPTDNNLQEPLLSGDIIAGKEDPPIQDRQPFEKINLLPTLAIMPKWKPMVLTNQ
jgi:hypothetical protein